MHPDSTPRLSDFLVVVRAGVLAAVVLGAGALSHVLGDGLLPPPGTLLLLLVLTAVGCTFFLQRPAGAVRLLVLVVGGQTLVHLALSVTAGHAGQRPRATVTPTVVPSDGQSLHEAYLAQQDAIWAAGRAAPDPLLHLVQHALDAGPLMIVTHTGAAVVVALWLAVGEQALATLLALTVHNVRAAVRALWTSSTGPVPHRRPVVPPADAWHVPTSTGAVVRRAITRRGPPLLLGS